MRQALWVGIKKSYKTHEVPDLDIPQPTQCYNNHMKLYRGTLEKLFVFPHSTIITVENLDAIDFDRVLYCEITPKGAMGNEGGILLYLLQDEDTLSTYETNSEVDMQTFEAVSKRIHQHAELFTNYYGGMGNSVYVGKNAQLEIDEKYNCFWYHSQNTKLRIDSSVQGVFLAVVADMKSSGS